MAFVSSFFFITSLAFGTYVLIRIVKALKAIAGAPRWRPAVAVEGS